MRVATCCKRTSDEGLLCCIFFVFSLFSSLEVAELSDLNGDVNLLQKVIGVSVCVSVLQCVAECCIALQCVAV